MRNDQISIDKRLTFRSKLAVLALCAFGSLAWQQVASAAPVVEAPSSLAANAVSETRIDISWKHSGSGISGFLIERSLSAGSGFSKIASTGSSARSYGNTGLSSSQTYYYRVRAYKQKGSRVSYSSYTSVASATTLSAAVPGAFEFSASGYSVNEGAGKVDITIKRVGGSDGAVTVEWRTKGVTATYAQDYGDFSWTTLSFADGEASRTLSVDIVNDTFVEGEESFYLLLGNPTGGAALGSITTAAVTIEDDDTTAPAPAPSPSPSLGYLPVFPGAQGFGTETKAGRGGQIIKVTNLNDSGAGSLRAAIAVMGPRIVVFEVSGTIILSSDLKITNPYATIAGQTAPSPGITLRGAGLRVQTHDVLVQHLRIRVGDAIEGPNPENRDAFMIGKSDIRPYNVVMDHISASWAIDENGSTWYPLYDVTISNSIISEGLHHTTIRTEAHSMGMLIGDHSKNLAFVGNLLAHNNGRYPLVKGDVSAVVMNNVGYNCGWGWMYLDDAMGSGPSLVSAVGNVFIAGVNSSSGWYPIRVRSSMPLGTKIYISDILASGPGYAGKSLKNEASFDPQVTTPPIWHPSFVAKGSASLEADVLANAGARPADRDSVDARVVGEVRNRTGSIIDGQAEVGGWPTLAKNVRAFAVPADPNGDDDGDGYTNIEEVLHRMAAQVEGR